MLTCDTTEHLGKDVGLKNSSNPSKEWTTSDWKAVYLPDGSYFDKTADVELVVEGHRLPAHKLVLAMQSEVFHNSFADTAPTNERVLVLETCFISTSIADIVLLLRYIYSLTPHEFLQNLSIQESAILAKMADQYRMPHLAKGCTAVLDTKFASLAKAAEPDPKLLDWMLFADRYRIQSLVAWCEHLVIKHFPTVAQDPRLLQLSGHCWQRIAAGISYAAMMGEARAKSNGFRPCTRHIAWGCPEYVCVIERAGPVLSDVPSKELLGKWNRSNTLRLDEE